MWCGVVCGLFVRAVDGWMDGGWLGSRRWLVKERRGEERRVRRGGR